ncbi:hypothetical protein OHA25_49280 [Nonomuraea sp. NBC_00507]|uniref:hypothetical protein n=1 Tax=Nonomuraea sp. NBC_00507 TaxID=2976002 RepID=UPI002E19A23A
MIPAGGQDPGAYRKARVRAWLLGDERWAHDHPATGVVEVSQPGYRPPGVEVRAALTDTLLTAAVRPSALAALDRDPLVVSVELTGWQ